MTRALWTGVLVLAAIVAIALAIALALGAPHPTMLERAAAGAFGLLGLGAGSLALSALVEAGLPARRRQPRLGEDLLDAGASRLLDIERSLRLGTTTAGDFNAHVRPILVPLAKARLARKGIGLDDRERAALVLGEENYELVDPKAPPPLDRFAPGVRLDQVRRLVEKLESLEDLR